MVQKTNITLEKAIEGFLLQKRAQQLSPHTLQDYQNALKKLRAHVGNPLLMAITGDDIKHMLMNLGSNPQPIRGVVQRPSRSLSKKSLLNIHTALSSFWTWAVEEGFAEAHIIKAIARPKPETRVIEPLSRDDVLAVLGACEYQRSYTRGTTIVTNPRITAIRDLALIRLMLDTGIRASELCSASLSDLDVRNNRLRVFGKGSKERLLPIGRRTSSALWKYLATRETAIPADPLFAKWDDTMLPLSRRGLITLLSTIGDRAGVANVHPHRLRHTFAINFLCNGGNIYALQSLLGHSSLDMVRRYLVIVQADIENAHRHASPIDNWKL